MKAVLAHAVRDAERLVRGGCDAIVVENMHDAPYLKGRVAAETVASMAIAVHELARLDVPIGLQILAGANRQALGVAVAAGAHFLRCEAFAYGHVADEGWMDACAGPLLRARAELGADDVAILADVQKKHASHAATADLSLGELARGHAFCGADGLVVTGVATGRPTSPADVAEARQAGLPVWVGSGVDEVSAGALARIADGLIVGSFLKEQGDWRRPVDPERVAAIRRAIDR